MTAGSENLEMMPENGDFVRAKNSHENSQNRHENDP